MDNKGKCLVCGSNQEWKEILKLEIERENLHKAKSLKDIQITANKLGFGSYSKFIEKCDHHTVLSDINSGLKTNYLTTSNFSNSNNTGIFKFKKRTLNEWETNTNQRNNDLINNYNSKEKTIGFTKTDDNINTEINFTEHKRVFSNDMNDYLPKVKEKHSSSKLNDTKYKVVKIIKKSDGKN